jgi:phosphogluconate dehydratase
VYPNGKADVNEFQAAGGLSIVIRELIDAGLLHDDVTTVMGKGLRRHAQEPFLQDMDGKMRLVWRDGAAASLDTNIVRGVAEPFSPDGGLRVLDGNLGRSVIKVSAVKPEHRVVEAPARVFHAQDDLIHAFKAGELERDFIAVLPYQGPAANGMPELHKLTPTLSVLQERTAACRAHRARCRRRSTSRRRRSMAGRWRVCATVTSWCWMRKPARCRCGCRKQNGMPAR